MTTQQTQRAASRTHTLIEEETAVTVKHVLVSSRHRDKRDGGRVIIDCPINRCQINSCFFASPNQNTGGRLTWDITDPNLVE